MLAIEKEVEKHSFERDLRIYGLPVAQLNAKKRNVYRQALKYRPEICAKCTTTLFCGVCSYGDWLF